MDHTAGWPVSLAVRFLPSEKVEVLTAAKTQARNGLGKNDTSVCRVYPPVLSGICLPTPEGRPGFIFHIHFSDGKTEAWVHGWLVVL